MFEDNGELNTLENCKYQNVVWMRMPSQVRLVLGNIWGVGEWSDSLLCNPGLAGNELQLSLKLSLVGRFFFLIHTGVSNATTNLEPSDPSCQELWVAETDISVAHSFSGGKRLFAIDLSNM